MYREPPSTVRHWISDRNLQLEVFTDATLELSNSIVGSFDMSMYIDATKSVQLGSYVTCMPAVVVIGGDGKILSKYVASSPGTLLKALVTLSSYIFFFLRIGSNKC